MDSRTLYSKLATVPTPIKKWLGSDGVIDEIDKMENRFTLPSGSSPVIAKLIQRVQIKDISPDYFSGELASELNLDKDKAVHITGELKKNVFLPIKSEFSGYGIDINLLDKFQMPGIKGLSPSTATAQTNTPKIVQDIGTAVPAPAMNSATPAAAPKPSTLSDIGWSKTPPPTPSVPAVPTAPTINPDPLRVSWIVPPKAPKPPSTAPAPAGASAGTATPKPPAPISAFASKPAPAEPAPVMLHEDTTFKAPEKNASFTLSHPQSGAEVSMEHGNVPTASPTRPAVLEFGGAASSARGADGKPPVPPAGAVHYTEFAAGPRNVSQITPPAAAIPVPKPPMPPTSPAPTAPPVPKPPAPIASQAPQPPKPPQPPQPPQKSTVIVKDFL